MRYFAVDDKVIYVKYSDERKKEYAIQTAIIIRGGKKLVRKKAIYPEGNAHIKQMVENCHILTEMYGKNRVAQCQNYTDKELYMEYVEGETLSTVLNRMIERKEYENFENMLKQYIDFLKISCLDNEENKIIGNDLKSPLRKCNIDLIFDNIIVRNDVFVIIDYEWLLANVDYRVVLSRAISVFEVRSSRANECYMIKKYKIRNDDANAKIVENLMRNVLEIKKDRYNKLVYCPAIMNPEEVKMIMDENEVLIEEIMKMREDIIKVREELKNIKSTRGYRLLEKIRTMRDELIQ